MNIPVVNAIISGSRKDSYQYKHLVLLGSRDFSDQVIYSNHKYVIRYNFDLHGQEVTIPENCIIAIDGGSISNGTLVGNNTILLNVNNTGNILDNVTLSGTWGQEASTIEPDTDNLSLMYFDTVLKKPLWWNGTEFIECIF